MQGQSEMLSEDEGKVASRYCIVKQEFPGNQKPRARMELWGTEGNLKSIQESSREKPRKGILVNDNKNGLSHLSYTSGTRELQRGRF